MRKVNQAYWMKKESMEQAGVITDSLIASEKNVARDDLGKRYVLDERGVVMVEGRDFLLEGENRMAGVFIPEDSFEFWDEEHQILKLEIRTTSEIFRAGKMIVKAPERRSWLALYDAQTNRLSIDRSVETPHSVAFESYEPTSEELPGLLRRIKSAYLRASRSYPEIADQKIITLFKEDLSSRD